MSGWGIHSYFGNIYCWLINSGVVQVNVFGLYEDGFMCGFPDFKMRITTALFLRRSSFSFTFKSIILLIKSFYFELCAFNIDNIHETLAVLGIDFY